MPKPAPSPSAPPNIASAGIRTPSMITWAVGCACQPIFSSCAPKLSPGVPFSMMKAEIPRGPVVWPSRSCHHHVDVRGSRARNELLDTVEHVITAVLDGAGAQCAGVGSRAGLGQAVAGDGIHRRQPRNPFLALFVGAEGVDHPRAHVVDGQECGGRRVGDGQLFEDPDPVEPTQPAAADVIAAVDCRHAELGGLTQHVARKMLGGIPFQGVRGKAFGGERGRRRGDDPFVIVQGKELHKVPGPNSLSG